MKNSMFFLMFPVFALLVSCGANDFRPVPSNQPHAVLKPEYTIGNIFAVAGTTYIMEIDGKSPSNWRWNDTFRVAPGKHSVGLMGSEGAIHSMAMLDFIAAEGKTYIAKSDQAGGLKMKLWIEEDGSKKVVASTLGNLQIIPQPTYTPIFIPVAR